MTSLLPGGTTTLLIDLSQSHRSRLSIEWRESCSSAPSLRSGAEWHRAKSWEAYGKQRRAFSWSSMLPRFLGFLMVFNDLQALCGLLRPPALRLLHFSGLVTCLRPPWAVRQDFVHPF